MPAAADVFEVDYSWVATQYLYFALWLQLWGILLCTYVACAIVINYSYLASVGEML